MNIDRINGLNKINKPGKKAPVQKASSIVGKDTVSLSKEALFKAEVEKYKEIAKASPDIRTDRVNELKAKINDPNYLNDGEVLKALSENIAKSLGLK
ncbi:MAG: flagellar biosynthesis anti-sigma factor FlgM [Spirochaetes bacterium]|nr:flagellar biosynthesis anti-sigma factor FlgM [Spirochaetota bacterium]MCK5266973.1 flagellar biosynthesis anti-sigma factor FlgM [Spirochaetota bacterium]